MVSPTFLDEVRRFCRTTSVRGVPRIINSNSTLQSVIWLLGVLTCSGLLTWQMVVIFDRYFSYRVSTLLVRSPLSENVEFPDITVCNLNPVVHESEMSLSYNDYSQSLWNQFIVKFDKNQIFNYTLSSQDTIFSRSALLNYFSSTNAYFTNFPMPVPLHFDSVLQNCSILDCSYYNWNGTENTDYRCFYNIDNPRGVYQRWVPSFYKCFTVSLNDSDRGTTVRGSTIIIDVDDYKNSAANPGSSDIAYSVSSGMQVLIHSPGSIPDMTLGIPIGVGMSTKILIDQTKVTHLPHPYSNCTTQKTLGVPDDVTPYTVKYCTDVCLQNHFLNECGCIANSLQFTANQLNQSNFIMCGNLSLNSINSSINYEGVKQIICATPVKARYQLACEYECAIPCEEYTYALTTSAAPWPPRSFLFWFYYTYIYGMTRFGNEFASYALKAVNHTNSEKDAIVDELVEAGIIKSRFLQLTVQFKSRTFMEQKDVATFSFDAFGAQIGGVLSLWLGVTIILVFELCEVIVNLLAMICSAKRNKPVSSEETIDTRL